MNDKHGYAHHIMLCWPANRAEIAKLNALVDPEQQFHPTVEHSLATCDGCQRDIWIGVQQRQLAASPLLKARKLCMFCGGQVERILGIDTKVSDINPGLAHARRRTT